MAVANVYTLYAFVVDRASVLVIDQVQDQTVNTGLQEMLLSGDGEVDPTFIAVGESRPLWSFTTTGVATMLAEVSDTFATVGLTLGASAIGKGFLQKYAEGGTRAAGASHILVAINEGLLVPRTLNVTGSGPATISCDAIATYDGSNAPFTITDSSSLMGTPAVAEAFACGPVSINGGALEGVQSISIDFGLGVMVLSGDGQVYPTFCAIQTRAPRITIMCSDAGALYDLGLTGTVQSATDSVVYLRKIAEGATRVATATEQHVSFTIDEGLIWVPTVSQAGGYQQPSVVIQPTYDGTNAILKVDTTAAIA